MTASRPAGELSRESPWPGLRSFTEADREFFFGRDREISEVLALIHRAPVAVVYGQSGLGKTSLLEAGLFHPLRDGGYVPFRVRLDHAETAPALVAQIKQALSGALTSAAVTAPSPSDEESLWAYSHRRDVEFWGPRNRLVTPVVVLDQFEEIFTLGQRSAAASARSADLISELEAMIEHRPPDTIRRQLDERPEDALKFDFQRESIKVVITLREDFLAQLDGWRGRMPSLLRHRFRLERMSGAQALEVVGQGGAALVDARVAQDIVDFVSRSQRRKDAHALESRAVEPALLSVVCDELNRRRLEGARQTITSDLISGEGEEIIQGFYDRAFDGIDPRVRDWIEDDLLTASGYRDRAALEDGLKAGLPEADIDRLVDRRLIHREERDGVVWLELTHDLLTDPAVASRVKRDQRRQAEASAAREAEIAKRLRRTRQLASVFGVLLLATIVALAFAFRMSARARRAQGETAIALDAAAGARDAMQAALGKARISEGAAKAAAESEQIAARLAEDAARLGTDSLDSALQMAQRDMRAPTGMVIDVINGGDSVYRRLQEQKGEDRDLSQRHAAFLAAAALALYQRGHISEGMRRATESLEAATPGSSSHAAARFAHATGLMHRGRLTAARREFEAVVDLTSRQRGSDPAVADLHAHSLLALADLDRISSAFSSARTRVARVTADAGSVAVVDGTIEPDVRLLMAYRLQGLIEVDPRAAVTSLDRADAVLERIRRRDPDNLHWVRMSADLAWLRGGEKTQMGLLYEAGRDYERARRDIDKLRVHDPTNRDWHLAAAQIAGAVAEREWREERYTSSLETLQGAVDQTKGLLAAEPEWRAARRERARLLVRLYDDLGAFRRPTDGLLDQALDAVQANRSRDASDIPAFHLATIILYRRLSALAEKKDLAVALPLVQGLLEAFPSQRLSAAAGPDLLNSRAWAYRLVANTQIEGGKASDARPAIRQSIDTLMLRATTWPTAEHYADVITFVTHFGDTLLDAGDEPGARAQYDEAERTLRNMPAGISPVRRAHWAYLVFTGKADLARRAGNGMLAVESLRRAADALWDAMRRPVTDRALFPDLVDTINFAEALASDPAVKDQPAARVMASLLRERPSSGPDSAWPMRPLLAGGWRMLADKELDEARRWLTKAASHLELSQIVAIRRRALDFRPDTALYEASVVADRDRHGVVTFLRTPRSRTELRGSAGAAETSLDTVLLDGTSKPIHDMNGDGRTRLDTAARVEEYARFFCGILQGTLGSFRIIDTPDDLYWKRNARTDARAALTGRLLPLSTSQGTDGSWTVSATLTFGTDVFTVALKLLRSGEMVVGDDEKPVEIDLPVVVDRAAGDVTGLKVLRDGALLEVEETVSSLETELGKLSADQPADKRKQLLLDMRNHLGRAAGIANAAGERFEAVRLQTAHLKEVLADPSTTKKEHVDAFNSLCWYQLFVKDFAGALDSCDKGLRLSPGDLYLQGNRAHALLALGRLRDAEAVYRAHVGKRLDTRLWQDVVVDDFDQLAAAGIVFPEFAPIRRAMAGAVQSR